MNLSQLHNMLCSDPQIKSDNLLQAWKLFEPLGLHKFDKVWVELLADKAKKEDTESMCMYLHDYDIYNWQTSEKAIKIVFLTEENINKKFEIFTGYFQALENFMQIKSEEANLKKQGLQ